MRRNLVILLAVGSLLWAGTDMSVLAVAVHEHVHHEATHDHHDAVRVAFHGHDHGATPEHDHEVTTTPAVSRNYGVFAGAAVAADDGELSGGDQRSASHRGPAITGSRDHGPPSYLLHCVLLT